MLIHFFSSIGEKERQGRGRERKGEREGAIKTERERESWTEAYI